MQTIAPQVAGGDQAALVELATVDMGSGVDAAMWRTWLADPDTHRRFSALVHGRGPDECAYWVGAISSTGHGKFRAGSRAQTQVGARPAAPSRIVTAHVYAYQLRHGVITPPAAGHVVIRHSCDETSCENWRHLLVGTQPENVRDYYSRRGRETGPLADHRGARGRAVAIRRAILTARRSGADVEQALAQAIAAGVPSHHERLFLSHGRHRRPARSRARGTR
jgi:hypothetical protein